MTTEADRFVDSVVLLPFVKVKPITDFEFLQNSKIWPTAWDAVQQP